MRLDNRPSSLFMINSNFFSSTSYLEMDEHLLTVLEESNVSANELAVMIANRDLKSFKFLDKTDPYLLKIFSLAQALLRFLSQCIENPNSGEKQRLQILENENRKLKKLLTLQKTSCSLLQQCDLSAKICKNYIGPDQSNKDQANVSEEHHNNEQEFQCSKCAKSFRNLQTMQTHWKTRHYKESLDNDEFVGPLANQIRQYKNALFVDANSLHTLQNQLSDVQQALQSTQQELKEERDARNRLQNLIEQEITDKLQVIQNAWLRGESSQLEPDIQLSVRKSTKNKRILERLDEQPEYEEEERVRPHIQRKAENIEPVSYVPPELPLSPIHSKSIVGDFSKSLDNLKYENHMRSTMQSQISPTKKVVQSEQFIDDNQVLPASNHVENMMVKQGEIVQQLAQDVQQLVSTLSDSLRVTGEKVTENDSRSLLQRLLQREIDSQTKKAEKRRLAEENAQRKQEAKAAKKKEKEARKALEKLKQVPLTSTSLAELADRLMEKEAKNDPNYTNLSLHSFASQPTVQSINTQESVESMFETSGASSRWRQIFKQWPSRISKKSKSMSDLVIRPEEDKVSVETTLNNETNHEIRDDNKKLNEDQERVKNLDKPDSLPRSLQIEKDTYLTMQKSKMIKPPRKLKPSFGFSETNKSADLTKPVSFNESGSLNHGSAVALDTASNEVFANSSHLNDEQSLSNHRKPLVLRGVLKKALTVENDSVHSSDVIRKKITFNEQPIKIEASSSDHSSLESRSAEANDDNIAKSSSTKITDSLDSDLEEEEGLHNIYNSISSS